MRMSKKVSMAVAGAALLTAAACSGGSGGAEEGPWEPTENVEFMVTGSAGGGSDQMARALEAEFTSLYSDVTVAVENYDSIETYLLLKAAAGDPHRLMTVNYGGAVLLPIEQDLDYSWRDYSPIAVIGVDYSYVVTAADSPHQSIGDLADAAQNGTVTVGLAVAGGQNSVLLKQLQDEFGVTFEPVVFDGGGQQLTSTIAGDVDFAIMEPGEFIQQAEAGLVRPLMVLGDETADTDVLTDVPTPQDEGIETDFVPQWRGFFAAGDLTDGQIEWWVEAVEGWVQSDSYDSWTSANLTIPEWIVGDELTAFLQDAEDAFLEARG